MTKSKNSFEALVEGTWNKSEPNAEVGINSPNERFIVWALEEIYYAETPSAYYENKDIWNPVNFRPFGGGKDSLRPLRLLNALRKKTKNIPWPNEDELFKPDNSNNDSIKSHFDSLRLTSKMLKKKRLSFSAEKVLTGRDLDDCDYQFSHIFDNTTKNPLAFNATWNLCRVPRFIDPLTGHETKWPEKKQFVNLWAEIIQESIGDLIIEYNGWMYDLLPELIEILSKDPDYIKGKKKKNGAAFSEGNFRQWMLMNFRPLFYAKGRSGWEGWKSKLTTEHKDAILNGWYGGDVKKFNSFKKFLTRFDPDGKQLYWTKPQ